MSTACQWCQQPVNVNGANGAHGTGVACPKLIAPKFRSNVPIDCQ